MIEAFWIPLLPPYLIGLVLSFAVEALLTPRPVAPWKRPMAAVGVHVGVWTLAFALELMLFRRPYFAVANVLAIELLIVLVSNAKYKALKEPFVYPDFEYFLDAIKHPRLYLPFFGVGKAVAAGGGYGLALWAGLALEDSVTAGAGVWLVSFADLPQEHMFDPTAPQVPFYAHSLGLGVVGLTVALLAGRRLRACFDTDADVSRLGQIGAFWAYALAERASFDGLRINAPFHEDAINGAGSDLLADLIVIQSESFFDARRAYPLVRPDVLRNFDLLKTESVQHGQLRVAAWGANTVRTEFAFLTGTDAQELGVHRYNPYRRLATRPFPTIASYLRREGYRTICIHPYFGSFYRRDSVYPMLGFDEFVDIAAFEATEREGAYVGDRALAEKVISTLKDDSDKPLYVHVITMENHGPLHLEDVSEKDAQSALSGPLPGGCNDLVAYVRHLRNADEMFGKLRDALKQRERPASLCIFGDHVPIMPTVYESLGETDGSTDYLVWHSKGGVSPVHVSMRVEHLAHTLLRSASRQ